MASEACLIMGTGMSVWARFRALGYFRALFVSIGTNENGLAPTGRSVCDVHAVIWAMDDDLICHLLIRPSPEDPQSVLPARDNSRSKTGSCRLLQTNGSAFRDAPLEETG